MLRIGALAKCAPPLRNAEEHELLWKRVIDGSVDVIASDHSPAPPSMKTGEDFFAIWGGIAGVQSTLAVLLGSVLPLERVAELTAGYPARRFHLENKGSIAVGNDADLTLVDLNQWHALMPESLFQKHRASPYTGGSFRGVIRSTVLRGNIIFQEGKITANSSGKLLRPTTYATTRIHP
jgi:allantoinase